METGPYDVGKNIFNPKNDESECVSGGLGHAVCKICITKEQTQTGSGLAEEDIWTIVGRR